METFPAKYFRYSTKYPESGTRIQLGRSYQFDTMPEAPDQRIFNLTLVGMTYFLDGFGAIDLTQVPELNLAVLEKFYNDHKRATSFYLDHPVYGQVECKFNRPLEIPEGIVGGGGTVGDIQVELIEIP